MYHHQSTISTKSCMLQYFCCPTVQVRVYQCLKVRGHHDAFCSSLYRQSGGSLTSSYGMRLDPRCKENIMLGFVLSVCAMSRPGMMRLASFTACSKLGTSRMEGCRSTSLPLIHHTGVETVHVRTRGLEAECSGPMLHGSIAAQPCHSASKPSGAQRATFLGAGGACALHVVSAISCGLPTS